MGATLNFIEIWLKLLGENYEARSEDYSNTMNDMFKKITKTMTKPLCPRHKVKKIMTESGGGWYMKKNKGILPLRRRKPGKHHKRRRIFF